MSTKIYDGMIIRNPKYEFIFKELQNFQDICVDLRIKFIRTSVLDNIWKLTQTNEINLKSEEWKKFRDSFEDLFSRIFGGISIILYPISNKRCLVLPFFGDYSVSKEIKEDFFKKINAEDYCYYDNTDEPEDVSPRAWKKREKDWNKVLLDRKMNVPSMSGLMYTITDEWKKPSNNPCFVQTYYDTWVYDFWDEKSNENPEKFSYVRWISEKWPDCYITDGCGERRLAKDWLRVI